jgi:Fructose-bisphosphate aldolase class-II
MLLTGTETLHLAAKQGWALPAFAVYNLEMVQAVVTAAEEADRPVLLLAGSSHFHHAGQTALMPSRYGGQDAPPSRPRRYEPSTRRQPGHTLFPRGVVILCSTIEPVRD